MRDVLDQVRVIADEYGFECPDDISEGSWRVAKFETKYIYSDVKRLQKPLEETYFEAVRQRNWERALLAYQSLVGIPSLSIDPLLYSERECQENEAEFIARAKEWIAEVEELLAS